MEVSARKFHSVNSRFTLFGIDRQIMVSLTLARSGQAERRTTMKKYYLFLADNGCLDNLTCEEVYLINDEAAERLKTVHEMNGYFCNIVEVK